MEDHLKAEAEQASSSSNDKNPENPTKGNGQQFSGISESDVKPDATSSRKGGNRFGLCCFGRRSKGSFSVEQPTEQSSPITHEPILDETQQGSKTSATQPAPVVVKKQKQAKNSTPKILTGKPVKKSSSNSTSGNGALVLATLWDAADEAGDSGDRCSNDGGKDAICTVEVGGAVAYSAVASSSGGAVENSSVSHSFSGMGGHSSVVHSHGGGYTHSDSHTGGHSVSSHSHGDWGGHTTSSHSTGFSGGHSSSYDHSSGGHSSSHDHGGGSSGGCDY